MLRVAVSILITPRPNFERKLRVFVHPGIEVWMRTAGLVCGVWRSCRTLTPLTHPEEKTQDRQVLRQPQPLWDWQGSGWSLAWLFKQRNANPTVKLMADSCLRCTAEGGGGRNCGVRTRLNTLLRSLGRSLTRLDSPTTAALHRDLIGRGGTAPRKLFRLRHIETHSQGTSSPSAFALFLIKQQWDKTNTGRASSEWPPPAGSNLASLRLPLHSNAWQKQLRQQRLTLHHLRWFVFSSEETRPCTPVSVRSHTVGSDSWLESVLCSRPPPSLSRCVLLAFC